MSQSASEPHRELNREFNREHQPGPEQVHTNTLQDSAALHDVIRRHLGTTFPALAVVALHQGQTRLDAAWGWLDPDTKQHPVTPDAVFDLASLTKLITSSALLAMVSEERFTLDDAVVSEIAEFGVGGPRGVDGGTDPNTMQPLPPDPALVGELINPADVTLRHLLTHTGGLAAWRPLFRAAGPAPVPLDAEEPDPVPRDTRWARAIEVLCVHKFVDRPGHAARYSDMGLMLLGEVVSRGARAPLDAVIRQRVSDPLGLKSLVFNPVLEAGLPRATIIPTGYDEVWRKRRCWGEVHDENAHGVGGVAAHAGLFGTARDVAAFGQSWLARDTRLGITRELMDEAVRQQVQTGTFRCGLGWWLRSTEDCSSGSRFSADSFGHTGFTGCSLWIDPQRELVVAALTNRVYAGRDGTGIHVFRQALHDAIVSGL